MKTQAITGFAEFLTVLTRKKRDDVLLFRGQHEHLPLLPKIARGDPTKDTTSEEIKMLAELRRRATLYLPQHEINDWDLLVYAQHNWMATRLLDWTSNPLIALWFACNEPKTGKHPVVYMLTPPADSFLDRTKQPSPFTAGKTRVFKPNLNNNRIIAQDGWFTAHIFSRKMSSFVPLEINLQLMNHITVLDIDPNIIDECMIALDTMGVNHQSVFPDIEGVCRHINWLFIGNP